MTPAKWVRIWNERLPGVPLTLTGVSTAEAAGVLREHGADAGFLRLPVDRTDLSAIPLYTETTVVVVPKDHLVSAVEEVTVEDLSDDIVLHPLDDALDWERLPGRPAIERPATTADAVELVAAGIGLLVVPQSLARLYHRKDLTYRPVTDAPQSRVALSWREDETTELVEQFIGIVRGRTVNSSRGPTPPSSAAGSKKPAESKKPTGSKKPAAQAARNAAEGKAASAARKPGRRNAGAPKTGNRQTGNRQTGNRRGRSGKRS